jgi:inorganic triphosphatase YgiF
MSMIETEIKLQVPLSQAAQVDSQVAAGASRRTRMRATYFDTPDRRLSAAGIALRIRQEGRECVQTLKTAGAGLLDRHEHTVRLTRPRPGSAATAALIDPQRHAGTPAGDRLAALLSPREGEPPVTLAPVYQTDLWRRHRHLRTRWGTVELAFDRGVIIAGDRREPVCELEIERVSGRAEAVIDVAGRWAARHALWIDLCSKAERGERLARGLAFGPPARARPVALARAMTPAQALRAVLGGCLAQVLRNAGEVASGRFEPEHVHQWRVGLRRMRCALRLFDEAVPEIPADWAPVLAGLFRQLGAARDRDALAQSWLPQLQAAGAPLVDLETPDPGTREAPGAGSATALLDPLSALARSAEFTALALAVQRFVLEDRPAPAGSDLRAHLAPRLARWHRQVRRDALRFADLDDESRHRLRKRIKRLRYSLEFVAALGGRKTVARVLDRLAPVQEGLGEFNDLCVALAGYRRLVEQDPRAWFAIGWLTARRSGLLGELAGPMKTLAGGRVFRW